MAQNRSMLKGTVIRLVALAAFSLLCASAAFAQGKQDFTLHNNTGVEIHKVYISPHSSNDWQEDILGKATLPDGESVDITFSRKETSKLWDLRIEDKDGTAIEWQSLNLLEISEVTLHFKDGKAWADVK